MAKKELVDKVIANKATKWEEKHRDKLTKMSDEDIELMIPVEIPPVVKNEKEEEEEDEEEEVKNSEKKEKGKKPAEEEKELTMKEWLAKIPAEARPGITNALKFERKAKQRLVASILNTEKGKANYDEKELLSMDVNELDRLNRILTPDASDELESYFGASNLVANARKNDEVKEEILPLPDYDAAYEKYAKQMG